MKETIQYMDALPDFVCKRTRKCVNIGLIENFMQKPQTIMQIDVTGKYATHNSAAATWCKTVRKTGYRICVKFAKHENREYIYLIKNTEGTATI